MCRPTVRQDFSPSHLYEQDRNFQPQTCSFEAGVGRETARQSLGKASLQTVTCSLGEEKQALSEECEDKEGRELRFHVMASITFPCGSVLGCLVPWIISAAHFGRYKTRTKMCRHLHEKESFRRKTNTNLRKTIHPIGAARIS